MLFTNILRACTEVHLQSLIKGVEWLPANLTSVLSPIALCYVTWTSQQSSLRSSLDCSKPCSCSGLHVTLTRFWWFVSVSGLKNHTSREIYYLQKLSRFAFFFFGYWGIQIQPLILNLKMGILGAREQLLCKGSGFSSQHSYLVVHSCL